MNGEKQKKQTLRLRRKYFTVAPYQIWTGFEMNRFIIKVNDVVAGNEPPRAATSVRFQDYLENYWHCDVRSTRNIAVMHVHPGSSLQVKLYGVPRSAVDGAPAPPMPCELPSVHYANEIAIPAHA